MKSCLALFRTFVILGLLCACPRPASAAPHVVGPGDVLEISVFAGGEKQQEFAAVTGTDGAITCPLVGSVRVVGLAVPAVAAQLQTMLARSYYVNPQVLVNVHEYGGKVFVMGEVRRPGQYDIGQNLGVLGACILAGGFTDFASQGKVKLMRMVNGKVRAFRVDLGRVRKGEADDPPLYDGDRIDVPRRLF
jgi:polysaccharide biosynthesis/export protein